MSNFFCNWKKDGFNDKRGQLIFTLANILSFLKPKYFIFENVKGVVNHNKGETLKTILKTLTEVGYCVYHKVLTTLDYGIPQMRQRIYFVGIGEDLLNAKNFIWPEEKPLQTNTSDLLTGEMQISDINYTYFKKYLVNSTNDGKYAEKDLLSKNNIIIDTRMNDMCLYQNKMPTLRLQRDGTYYVKDSKFYQLTGAEALLFQGFTKDKIDKAKNIVSDRHLLMQAGNAMLVNVTKEIRLKILETQEEI